LVPGFSTAGVAGGALDARFSREGFSGADLVSAMGLDGSFSRTFSAALAVAAFAGAFAFEATAAGRETCLPRAVDFLARISIDTCSSAHLRRQ
jgi:hypothetical protein